MLEKDRPASMRWAVRCISVAFRTGSMAALYSIHLEMQMAFKNCARSPNMAKMRYRTLTTFPSLRARNPSTPENHQQPPPKKILKDADTLPETIRLSSLGSGHRHSNSDSTQLTPRTQPQGNLQRPRRADVPARLLPNAQISPGLTLSPRERLQIEFETRRPPRAPDKPSENRQLVILEDLD